LAGQSQIPVVKAVAVADVATYIPITQLSMSLSGAYLAFANRSEGDLDHRLSWIREVAISPVSGSEFYRLRAERLGSDSVGQPSSSELADLSARASILLDRMRLGLDVFGHSPNFVGSLSPEYLSTTTKRRFDIAIAVETAHDTFFTKLSNLTEAKAQLNDALKLTQQTRQQIILDKQQYDAHANQAQDEIQALDLTISELTTQLQVADYKLQDAIAGKSNCSIGQMIEFVVGVIAICYGVYAGVVAIADSMKTVNTSGNTGNVIKDLEFVVETFDKSKVSEYFTKMQEGFRKVQEALKNNDTKLVVSLESFEQQLAPYLSMPEASGYQTLMRQLVDVARTKNDKLLSYTQLVLKSLSADKEQSALASESDRVATLLAETNNPALVECVTYLTRYLASSKREILELLDLQRRSLMYTSLVPIQPSYRWERIVDLQQVQATLLGVLVKASDDRGQAAQNFSAEYLLTRSRHRAFFKVLEEHGESAFAIPLDDPEFNRGGTSFVTVYAVDLVASGLRSRSGKFTCRLTHQGNSTFRDQSGNLMNFVHRKRPTILSYKEDGGVWKATYDVTNNLGGSEDKYLYLSPFAGWTLRTDDRGDGVDWTNVREIKLLFKARDLPSAQVNFHSDVQRAIQQ
jgi:hypothetical protein